MQDSTLLRDDELDRVVRILILVGDDLGRDATPPVLGFAALSAELAEWVRWYLAGVQMGRHALIAAGATVTQLLRELRQASSLVDGSAAGALAAAPQARPLALVL